MKTLVGQDFIVPKNLEILFVKNYNYTHSAPFVLESGAVLSELLINYSTFGAINGDGSNVIWICHALTANSNPSVWWSELVGEGKFYDPEHYFIICANVIGSCYGSSGPLTLTTTSEPAYYQFPQVTIRDMVKAHELLRAYLNIENIHTCIGGSVGGQQAMEWAIMQPQLIQHLIVLCTNAFHSPWGIACNEAQRMALCCDPTFYANSPDAGKNGMKAARAMALLTYRNYHTYCATQQEQDIEKLDDYAASSYQKYQGEKLEKRFNAHAYWLLSKAMDSHHVGRGRGGAELALAQIFSKTLVVGITSDILFPVSEQEYLAKYIPNANFVEIESLYGHDGFLIETEKIEFALTNFYK